MLFFTAKTKAEKHDVRFTIEEIDALSEFAHDHQKRGHGAIFDLAVHDTGIADAVDVTCHGCGETKDITDYDSW
jgi:hypothetical protein